MKEGNKEGGEQGANLRGCWGAHPLLQGSPKHPGPGEAFNILREGWHQAISPPLVARPLLDVLPDIICNAYQTRFADFDKCSAEHHLQCTEYTFCNL